MKAIVRAAAFLLVVFVLSDGASALYVCYPNNTVVYDNPDVQYVSSAAKNSNGVECTTTWIADGDNTKSKVQITGCTIDVEIYISLSDRVQDGDSIVGGKHLYSATILCDQIHATGIMRTVTQGLSPTLSTASEAAVSPTFTVSSALRITDAVGAEQNSATVGDQLTWTIDIPDEYTALLTLCSVYPGTSTSGTATTLVTNGCSNDDDLVTDFSASKINTAVSHINRYYTDFWAFKFYNNNHILIHCTIKFCPPSSTACDMSACSRKRRAIGTDVSAGNDDETGVKRGETSKVLRVFEKSRGLSLGSGVPRFEAPSCWTLVSVATVLWLLM